MSEALRLTAEWVARQYQRTHLALKRAANGNKQFRWAKSAEEYAQLLADGYEVADQRTTHHSYWSVLMVRDDPMTEMG